MVQPALFFFFFFSQPPPSFFFFCLPCSILWFILAIQQEKGEVLRGAFTVEHLQCLNVRTPRKFYWIIYQPSAPP